MYTLEEEKNSHTVFMIDEVVMWDYEAMCFILHTGGPSGPGGPISPCKQIQTVNTDILGPNTVE